MTRRDESASRDSRRRCRSGHRHGPCRAAHLWQLSAGSAERSKMITADRQRRYANRMNGSEEGGDFGERALQLEGPFDPGISQIGDANELEGRHAGRLIDLADKRRLVADVARAVARAWA